MTLVDSGIAGDPFAQLRGQDDPGNCPGQWTRYRVVSCAEWHGKSSVIPVPFELGASLYGDPFMRSRLPGEDGAVVLDHATDRPTDLPWRRRLPVTGARGGQQASDAGLAEPGDHHLVMAWPAGMAGVAQRDSLSHCSGPHPPTPKRAWGATRPCRSSAGAFPRRPSAREIVHAAFPQFCLIMAVIAGR
jgi:hypothetical protein